LKQEHCPPKANASAFLSRNTYYCFSLAAVEEEEEKVAKKEDKEERESDKP